jgi:hypothetical protein
MGLVCALVVALAVVAGLVGHHEGESDLPTPTSFTATPVPAARPSYPVTPAKVVADDAYPALEPGIPLRPVTLGSEPFLVRVPVPRGWVRSDATAGEWRWYPAQDKTKNIYFVRVRQVGANYNSVPTAIDNRISDLQNAADVDDLVIEDRRPDRFVSHYVSFDHLRVSYEGYVPRGEYAFVWIAVIGREADRAGLSNLFDRMMSGAQTTVG